MAGKSKTSFEKSTRARQRGRKLKFAISNNRSSAPPWMSFFLSFPPQLTPSRLFLSPPSRTDRGQLPNVQFDSETSRGWHFALLLFGETRETRAARDRQRLAVRTGRAEERGRKMNSAREGETSNMRERRADSGRKKDREAARMRTTSQGRLNDTSYMRDYRMWRALIPGMSHPSSSAIP